MSQERGWSEDQMCHRVLQDLWEGSYVNLGVGIPIGGGGGSRRPEGQTAEGNRRAIEAELAEKALPEVSAWDPVAGYLYFSVPKKKKGGYELVYMAGDKKVVLPLK